MYSRRRVKEARVIKKEMDISAVFVREEGVIWKRMLASLIILVLIILSMSAGLINSIVLNTLFLSVPDT